MRCLLLSFAFVFLAGCGCLEPATDGPWIKAGAAPDPDQPAWQRCLFGTRYVPLLPPLPLGRPGPLIDHEKKI